jgi:hypothetical protein
MLHRCRRRHEKSNESFQFGSSRLEDHTFYPIFWKTIHNDARIVIQTTVILELLSRCKQILHLVLV